MSEPDPTFRDNETAPQPAGRVRSLNPNQFRFLLRKAYERKNACSWITLAPTGSMDPMYGGQTTVFVRWGDKVPSLGDVVLLTTPDGILTVHRAVATRRDPVVEILQMADHFSYRDPYSGAWIPGSNVLGRVIGFRRIGMGPSYVTLDTHLARSLNRLLAYNSLLLWHLGGENADWFHRIEPLRKLGFYAAKTVHLTLSYATICLLRCCLAREKSLAI